MAILRKIYGDNSLAMVADFYQFTAAYALWKADLHETQTCFNMFHRSTPFDGGYAICAGLEYVQDWVEAFKPDTFDVDFLASVTGNDGKPLFPDEGFLKWLEGHRLHCDIDAVPEGSLIFPHEPMLRTTGSIVDALFVESFALCTMNSQSLFATLASRMVQSAGDDPVLDGGLRRAQGLDGAISATRACYIGGVSKTSNTFAGKILNIPVGGTLQHAFIMFFDTEIEAFETYAEALPNNCVFLVDTYGTIAGIKNAITVCNQLKSKGYEPIGIRLDSGDLAWLSKKGRVMLDEAGLTNVKIGGSNDLDERLIKSLKEQGCTIATWLVGTKLLTSYNQPAFGGVYKMGAMHKDGRWEPKIKLSDQAVKTSNPGMLNAARFERDGMFVGDMIYDELSAFDGRSEHIVVHPETATNQWKFDLKDKSLKSEQILVPAVRGGKSLPQKSILVARSRAAQQLRKLPEEVKRFDNPHEYPLGLDLELHRNKVRMLTTSRGRDIYAMPLES